MSALRPFRFGILSFFSATSSEVWRNRSRAIETAGFSTLQLPDHLADDPGSRLGPIASMVAATQATTKLRVGSYVFGNDFRNPVFLAQEAASIDVLSDGRLELGVGTGYYASDYSRSGIPLESPMTRVSRLEEGVKVIKGFFSAEPFSFTGKYYSVKNLEGQPKSIQRPHPPIMIGGGSRRILSFAAREADIVSINVKTTPEGGFDMTSITAAANDQKVAWVREAAGERFNSLELNTLVPFLKVTDQRRQDMTKMLQDFQMPSDDASVDQMLSSPSTLFGTVDQIVEDLHQRRERYGFSYITLMVDEFEPFIPIIKRLAGN